MNSDFALISLLVRIAHLINLFCMVILIRSGIQILSDHPKLYWTDHTTDDNHWLKFGKKVMPKDRLWTALDEPENPGPLALPGGTHNLGSGRHWHFATAIIWMITGLMYVIYLFAFGEWQRVLPSDIGVFQRATAVFFQYLTFNIPPEPLNGAYNALQQLTYAGVIFILSPLMILTGLAMSPALIGRFPRFLWIFANRRQAARSIHFLGMIAFSLFVLVHITIAMVFHFTTSVARITLGNTHGNIILAVTILFSALILLVAVNVWITVFTLADQMRLRRILTAFYTPVVRLLFGWMESRQHYKKSDISPFFRVNGYPPKTPEYEKLQANNFKDWKLKVNGLVENPQELSLNELRELPKHQQITKHNCIQGWSGVAEWGGVQMSEILKLCKPTKEAKYVVFHCHDKDDKGAYYYTSFNVSDMRDEQTMLAYEMNYETLPIKYGAPLRLRCEKKLGFKMAKYLKSIEFVKDFKHIGKGKGGYREDGVFFDWEASI